MTSRTISRAVITGPTGAIGTALIKALSERGITVYAVCRPDSKRIHCLPKGENVVPVLLDLSEIHRLPEWIPGGADAFFHLGWMHTIGPGRNDLSAQTKNIQLSIDAVHCAKILGCRVFIGAGSQAEYGRSDSALTPDTPARPENGYGAAKLCAGHMTRLECQKLGIDHIWCRILSVYGPGDGENTLISYVIRTLLSGNRPALTEGIQEWDYLYNEDAARALMLLAEKGKNGKTYVLGSGKHAPLSTYIETIRDLISPSLPLGFGEVPYGPGQVMFLSANLDALTEDTGFQPLVSFTDGIISTIEHIKGTE